MKACDMVKPHFGSLVGCIFWPTCALLHYFRIDGADIRCKQWEQAYHGTLCIGYLSGQACTRWLWLLTNGQCWGAQGFQRIMFLIVVVHYLLWPQEGSYCASREVDGTTLIPHLYRKAIGAYNGTMWIFQDLLHSESQVAAIACLHGTMKTPIEWLCIEVLLVGWPTLLDMAHGKIFTVTFCMHPI